MTEMPRDTRSQKIGRQAPSIAHVWFEKHGLIWRPGDTATDFGVDGELEITGNEVSGLLIKAQIKGVAGASFTAAGVHTVAVKATTMNYWAALHLPVVAFLVDTQAERIYWTQPSPIFDEKTPKLVFRSDQCPADDPKAFKGMLRQLAQWPTSSAVLDHVDAFLDVYLDLRSDMIGDRDLGYDAEPDEVLHIELLYEHVLRLRGLLGLADTPIVPLSAWRSRSDYIDAQHFDQSSNTGLLDLVAGELLDYLGPIYKEALVRVGEIAADWSVVFSHPRLADCRGSGRLDPTYLDSAFDRVGSSLAQRGSTRSGRIVDDPTEARAKFEELDRLLAARDLRRWGTD